MLGVQHLNEKFSRPPLILGKLVLVFFFSNEKQIALSNHFATI